MNSLSIILSCHEKEVYNYIDNIKDILDNYNYQLIIINNVLNSINTEYEYTIYNYTESYNKFRGFCLSLCKYDKVLFIESGVQLNKIIVDSIRSYIIEKNDVNFQCDFRVYIDKNKFFLRKDTLIYNTKSNKNKELNITLDDYSLLCPHNSHMEASINKLISYNMYKELYEWSETFSDDMKISIYNYVEKEKLKLNLDEINYIEEEFLKEDFKDKYTNYLKIKNLYKNYKETSRAHIISHVKENRFSDKDTYFSFFVLETFNRGTMVLDTLALLDNTARVTYLKYLFELDEKFYLKIFNFMISIDLLKELNEFNSQNIKIYFDIIKTYIDCMSSKSEDIDKKEKLIQMFTDYTNCGLYLLEKNMIQGEEAEFLVEINKSVSKLNEDINVAVEILKSASEKFQLMTLCTRYYIQKLVYENNLYTSKLSICMIVKNEEKNIERCLNSLKPLIDKEVAEIILVDTGSTDRTVEIASRYLNNIYFHQWTGSFSEARNWSLSLATGEYIFIVDGDDEIKDEDINKIIREFTESDYKKYNTFSVKIKSYFTQDLDSYSTITQNHIFKNDGSFYYSGAVHNQPVWKNPIKHLDISIMHYGYIMTPEVSEKKFNRTVPLLKKELEKNFNDVYKSIYYRYQLASSYNMHYDYKEALEEVAIYLKTVKDNWNKIKNNYNITYNTLGVIIYMNNELYDEALDICDRSLKLSPDYIDFIYYKSKILFIKKNYKESIEYMKKYLKILDKFDSLSISKDERYVFYTLNLDKEIILRIINSYYQLKNYRECLNYIKKIEDEEILKQIIYIVFECYFRGREFKNLIKLYENQITSENYHIFNYYIRKNLSDLSKEDQKLFIDTIINSGINTKYIDILNESALDTIKSQPDKILYILDKCDIENIDTSGAKTVLEFMLPIVREYDYLKYNDLTEIKSFKRCIRFILNRSLNLKQFDMFSNEELLNLLDKYISTCSTLINLGEKKALEEKEYKFCTFIIQAFEELKKNNLISAVRFIRDAVNEDNEMARPMELFINETFQSKNTGIKLKEEESGFTNMNDKLDKYSKEAKKKIEELINKGYLDDALNLIKEYETIISNDVDIYSMKAVALIMQNNLVSAKEVLERGLKLDKFNFDLLYNLAYVYENLNDFNNSLRAYVKAKDICKDESMVNGISATINKIKSEHKNIIKQRIIFFVKQGMDNFIDDIIRQLSHEFEVKKVITTSYNQIDEGMEWADICWFEWCDELIAYGSKHSLARTKKILCRVHSYEAFTSYPLEVNWLNVDKVIFIADSIRDIVCNKVKIDTRKINVIPNGINTDKYTFKDRSRGFNIAYVGYINYKKGPMLLLHTFKAIVDKDSRYKLYIAGKFQDERDVMYFEQMIKEMNLENNVIYQGWQENLNSWLEDKNYILCTSILESQNISVMEAMTKGIKPLIHNFVGAKQIYNRDYTWNSINEAVDMINSEKYNSKEYRSYIEDNYSLKNQIVSIKNIIYSLDEKSCPKQISSFVYSNKRVKFYLPYLNDHIQNVIYSTESFYEITMLEDIKNRIGNNKIILDVGANIGNHTVFFGMFCDAKRVYSFEPQGNVFSMLKTNVQINNLEEKVTLFNIGLGREKSKGTIVPYSNDNLGMAKVNISDAGNIEVDSLDNVLFENEESIDLIKIDVEGMELEVLKGAKNIIAKHKPLIYIESDFDEEFKSIKEFLNNFGYTPSCRFNATPTYLFINK